MKYLYYSSHMVLVICVFEMVFIADSAHYVDVGALEINLSYGLIHVTLVTTLWCPQTPATYRAVE